jgi:hypothetical protein
LIILVFLTGNDEERVVFERNADENSNADSAENDEPKIIKNRSSRDGKSSFLDIPISDLDFY